MTKKLTLFLIESLAILVLAGQGIAQTVSGLVTDDQRAPLVNVSVVIPALERRAVTGADGKFEIANVTPGMYVVEFYRIGFEKETRLADCSGGAVTLEIMLKTSPLELPAVTVTTAPQPVDLYNSAQPVSVLEGRAFQRNRGQSLMNSAEFLPGVSTFSRGPLNMKPVVRGLTAQRVVVAEDGMRHESQQWDDEQSPEVDIMDVDHIEIQRGANSVLYGSDALGGVVNFVRTDPSTLSSSPVCLGGSVLLNGFSNNSQASGGLTLFGSNDAIEYKGQFSARHAGDIMTPDGSLSNSGVSEVNGSGMFGLKGNWGTLRAEYSHFGQEFHIHPEADSPEPTPTQVIDHDKGNIYYNGLLSGFRLEAKVTYQSSERAEYDDEELIEEGHVDSAGIRLKLNTLAGDVRIHHAPMGNLYGTIGVSGMRQTNETLGLEPLIPGFTQTNFAGFVYEEYRMGEVSFSGGLRFDSRKLDVDENDDLEVTAQSRSYTAVTGTAGAVWHPAAPVSLSLNVGRGWRAPIAEELFINGPDEGSIRFKIGNPYLTPEESFNLNLTGKFTTQDLSAEISLFRNRINDYIYLSPNGVVDSSSGFNEYEQRQADATLTGMEIDVQGAVTEHIVLHGGFDMVLGKNEETQNWLPLIPARRFQAGIQYLQPTLLFLNNARIWLAARAVMNQEKVDPFESPTGGYTLYDAGIGGEIPFGVQHVIADFVVQNMFNKAYFDHLSRYKNYALNPGVNFALKFTVPFTLVE